MSSCGKSLISLLLSHGVLKFYSEVVLSRFESQFHHLLIVRLRASYLNYFLFCFFFEMRIVVAISKVCEDSMSEYV